MTDAEIDDDYCILVGKTPIKTTAEIAHEWKRRVGIAGRRVAETTLPDAWVSTVFCINPSDWDDDFIPRHFETLVFCGPLAGEEMHAKTWAEAEANHAAMVEACKKGGN